MSRSLQIPAFAKVNLCLRVLQKREDGYHELRTILQAIDLHDDLLIARTPGRSIALEIVGADVPGGPENLVWRAVDLCRREWRWTGGVSILLNKRIPVGRGLGGGSSDAAAAIIGMQRLTGRKIPHPRIFQMAASLGSDVPFSLLGGRALGIGRGEEIFPLLDGDRLHILVVSPRGIFVSTPEAYSWLSPTLTNRGIPSKIYEFCALCRSPQVGSLPNDFQKVVFQRHARLKRIQRALLQHGAVEAALAGSGSAVFGVFRNPVQARRAARLFPEDQTFVTKTLTRDECARAWRWKAV